MPSEDLYRDLVENMHDGIYFVDHERRITYWNKGAERITGYSAAEVVGKSCADNILVHVDAIGRQLCKGSCPLVDAIFHGNQLAPGIAGAGGGAEEAGTGRCLDRSAEPPASGSPTALAP